MTAMTRPRIGRYVLPNRLATSDDARKLAGHDIADMTDRELFAEAVHVNAALADAIASDCRVRLDVDRPPYTISAIDWLERRLRIVQGEMRRRRGSDR